MENISTTGLTRQREIVLRVLRESNEHLTANEVFELSRQLLSGISFSTVYNSLRYLKEAGYIAEVSFGNGASRFDPRTSRHDHAFCTRCGKLVDMEIEMPPEIIYFAAETSGFKIESVELTLRGLCPECRK